jgi:hypothetical protein
MSSDNLIAGTIMLPDFSKGTRAVRDRAQVNDLFEGVSGKVRQDIARHFSNEAGV